MSDVIASLGLRLAAWTGLDLERGVHAYVLRDVIRRRAAAAGITVEAYASAIRAPGDAEAARLIDFVTVCHSWFFRDPEQLAVVERLIGDGPPDMDIWLAACAGGEEAYTIAMLAHGLGRSPYILATDINTEALSRARAGRYGAWSVKAVPPAFAARFTARGTGLHEVDPAIRLAVELQRHNLMDAPPSARKVAGWDLILCRNVLMYFKPREAEATIRRLANALRPGGHLILGASDILPEAPPPLRFVSIGGRYVLQRSTDLVPAAPKRAVTEPMWSVPSSSSPTRPLRPPRPLTAPSVHDRPPRDEPLAAGARAFEAGNFAAAIGHFAEAMVRDPLSPEAAALTGIASFLNGDAAAALFELRRALVLDPDLWQAELYLAMCHERLGHVAPAATAFRRLREILTRPSPPPRAIGALAGLEAWRTDALAIACQKAR